VTGCEATKSAVGAEEEVGEVAVPGCEATKSAVGAEEDVVWVVVDEEELVDSDDDVEI